MLQKSNNIKLQLDCKSIVNIIKIFYGVVKSKAANIVHWKVDSDTYDPVSTASFPPRFTGYFYCVSFKQLIHKIATLLTQPESRPTHAIALVNVGNCFYLLAYFELTIDSILAHYLIQ